ncbi:MAG: hypothetical protein PHI63_02965 [Patescibacteria group bacterium]|nr:hypothetical protein [Patescibacteria group bacterium]
MRLPLPSSAPINLRQFLLRCGYGSHYNPLANRMSFVRRLSVAAYPRYHLYHETDVTGRAYFNLHLDQKRPSYPGVHAHSAEYDGALVEREGKRIYQLLQASVAPTPPPADKPRKFWPWIFGQQNE